MPTEPTNHRRRSTRAKGGTVAADVEVSSTPLGVGPEPDDSPPARHTSVGVIDPTGQFTQATHMSTTPDDDTAADVADAIVRCARGLAASLGDDVAAALADRIAGPRR